MMGGIEHRRVFHAQRGEVVDIEEASIVDLVAGDAPVGEAVSLHLDPVSYTHLPEYLDGLLLQGGADVNPQSYGEEPMHPDWAGDMVRDAYEMELLHEFIEAGKAVLGICRGAQVINVALGGTLYQDIATQIEGAGTPVHDDYDRPSHAIAWDKDSGLAKLYPGSSGGNVISIHHQSSKTLGRGLKVEARGESDGIVEAVRPVSYTHLRPK